MSTIKAGDIVRVKNPADFISSFSKKVADRDAVVQWVGPDRHGQFVGRARVLFQKRSGRGKEFAETMSVSDLVIKAGA